MLVGAEVILQAGDFGFWPNSREGRKFLDSASDLVDSTGIPLYFVDGNHEDHNALDALGRWAEEPVEVYPGIFHIPRGIVATFGETRVLGLGGAVSVDKDQRLPEVTWFRRETMSLVEWGRAMDAEDVDLVLAHDVPSGVKLDLWMKVPEHIENECNNHRAVLREIMDRHSPKQWVAGHYHQLTAQEVGDTLVTVLAHDGKNLNQSSVARNL